MVEAGACRTSKFIGRRTMNARQIKAARAALNWTQEDLAKQAGVHPKAIACWEAPGRDGSKHKVGAPPAIRDALTQAGIEFQDGRLQI
jgi:transcriptional regulator with XRE-family HTH domain